MLGFGSTVWFPGRDRIDSVVDFDFDVYPQPIRANRENLRAEIISRILHISLDNLYCVSHTMYQILCYIR